MKILFLNLPYKFNISRSSRWPEKTKSGTLYYPFYLSYCAGVCDEKGIETNLIDCITNDYTQKDTVETVKNYQPDYLMVEITTSTCEYDYQTLTMIKEACPNIKIIVGGTHATILPETVLKECAAIDYITRKEYDYTVPEIVEKGDVTNIKGVSYHNANGEIINNPDREPILNLDDLPFVSKVYHKFLNVNDYAYSFAQKPMIQIFSARGCPNLCNFCSYPSTMGGRIFRTRSPKNLVDEIEYINKQMPEIKEIFIEDDTFTVDKKRVEEVCDEIMNRGLKVIWSCNSRVDLPYETMKKMKEAGCRLLVCGYESGSQKILDKTKKGITLEQSLAYAENTKKLGIKTFGCFMIGNTGEDLNTIQETFEFAKKVQPDMCFFQQAVPFPGTELYQWADENGYMRTHDFSKWLNKEGYLDCLIDYPYADHKEIEKIRDDFMSKYYFSASYIIKSFFNNLNWVEFKRLVRGGWAYFTFRTKKLLKKED